MSDKIEFVSDSYGKLKTPSRMVVSGPTMVMYFLKRKAQLLNLNYFRVEKVLLSIK
jgi:hypothetical protein